MFRCDKCPTLKIPRMECSVQLSITFSSSRDGSRFKFESGACSVSLDLGVVMFLANAATT